MDNSELRELLAKATPGEWQSMNEYQWDSIIGDIDGPDDGEMHYESVADITSHHARSRANAALIAAMRNALPELLRIYRAWQGAAVVEVGELGTILVTERSELIPQGPENPKGYAQFRCYMREKDVCVLSIGDDIARAVAGTRVRLLPDDGQGA